MVSIWSEPQYLDLVFVPPVEEVFSPWTDGQYFDLTDTTTPIEIVSAWTDGQYLDLTYVPAPDISPWSKPHYRDLRVLTKASFAFLTDEGLKYIDLTPR
jgi:aryl-phospho-beta-D-glucosidase BglC (GH1 family)